MAVKAAPVSVGTTATLIAAASDSAAASAGESVAVGNNDSSVTVYLGASDVTTGTGLPLPAGALMAVELGVGESLYGIVGAGTVDVRVLRAGVA